MVTGFWRRCIISAVLFCLYLAIWSYGWGVPWYKNLTSPLLGGRAFPSLAAIVHSEILGKYRDCGVSCSVFLWADEWHKYRWATRRGWGDNGKELGAPGCTKRWSLQGVQSGWEERLMQTAAGVLRIIMQRGMERQEDNENHPPASQLCVATVGKRGPW